MKTLRDTAQREIDEQLIAIKAMRANEAAAMIARNLSRTQAADASQVRSLFTVCHVPMAKFINDHPVPHQTPVLTSLKRKRDDTDENGDEEEVVEAHQAEASGGVDMTENTERSGGAITAHDDVVMKDAIPTASTDIAAALAIRAPEPPRPRKRARRFVRAMAQTATAVTIGAVVTWSALAFS
jgi:hypothetical protein